MKKRTLALLLALFMLLPAFAGCGNDTPAEETLLTVPEETTEAETIITLVSGGKSLFAVVRPDESDTDSPEVLAATEIRQALGAYCTESVTITNDFVMKGQTHDSETYEILVGLTNYDETAEVAESLAPGEYAVRLVGNKIVVYGNTDTGMKNASNDFIAMLETAESSGGNLTLKASEIDITNAEIRLVSSLPAIEGVDFENFYNPGDDCDEAIYKNATLEAYDAYVKKLQEAGYKLHAAHVMNGNSFATLYTEKTTVNVGFYAGEQKIRIIAEPYSDLTLYGEAEAYTKVTTLQLTMLGVMYVRQSDGKNENTGACLVIRCEDGRFIIIDGGHSKESEANELLELLNDQSADYRTGSEKPVVAAWIITHPHSDHWSVLKNYYGTFRKAGVTVENIIFNQLAEEEYAKTSSEQGWSATLNGLDVAANYLKAGMVIPHVGHVYYYAGVTAEILYTYESQGPIVPNDANQMSLLIKFTFTDSSTGQKTVFMANGDGTGLAFRNIAINFGDYLACDIAQIAHHGASTKGNDAGTIMAYKLMAPKTVLWTSGDGAYTAYAALAYNAAMVSRAQNPNFREVYVASSVGKRTVLTMPYSVGGAQISY